MLEALPDLLKRVSRAEHMRDREVGWYCCATFLYQLHTQGASQGEMRDTLSEEREARVKTALHENNQSTVAMLLLDQQRRHHARHLMTNVIRIRQYYWLCYSSACTHAWDSRVQGQVPRLRALACSLYSN